MWKKLDLLKGMVLWEEKVGKDWIIDKVVSDMDKVNKCDKEDKEEVKTKKTGKSKKQNLSWEWVKTDWWWRWEWETDKDWYAIERKENRSAYMYHIERSWWYWVEWTGKEEKGYKVWDITFKRTGAHILAYKKDNKLHCVKRVKKPFNLAQRLYETGHAYQQKWKEWWWWWEEWK